MKKNRLRELLNEGRATFGTRVITPWAGIIEVIGHSGAFDYIEYVGENSPFSLEILDNIGQEWSILRINHHVNVHHHAGCRQVVHAAEALIEGTFNTHELIG